MKIEDLLGLFGIIFSVLLIILMSVISSGLGDIHAAMMNINHSLGSIDNSLDSMRSSSSFDSPLIRKLDQVQYRLSDIQSTIERHR